MSIEGSELSALGSVPTAAGSDSPGQTPAAVTKIIAGTGISVSPAGGTGDVTVTNSAPALVTKIIAGTGISVSPAGGTGDVTVTNTAPFVTDAQTAVGETALLDLTTIADNIAISIPQRAGFYFCPFAARVFFKDITGTATAGTLTISYGNDAGHTNSGSTAFSVATVNALASILPTYATLGAGASSMIDSGTAFKVKISAVLTGVTAAHGRVVVIGFWVPV
jgi:hypothetical protein